MKAPAICPDILKSVRINLPKRNELLFRTVCAFLNASSIGLARRIYRERFENWRFAGFELAASDVAIAARY